ncbi:MAG: ATP-binding cassette domain-containing protein [Beijerinckiaceae bacterium]|jgi:tungstate transport system ATP-binding protein
MTPPALLPLRAQALTFEAGGETLLADVSFSLGAGEFVAAIGPNGAGKSLLLRLCHGLIAPSRGHARWADGAPAQAHRLRHGLVFQKPVMLRRSARANVLHTLAAAGLPRREREARAEAALERFGLQPLAQRPARLLSGGEQQRLAIARAVALRPDALFLDEPTSALDPGATRQVEEMLHALKADGLTMMMATHDLAQARRLADRVFFLHRGRLVEDAPARDFFAGPASSHAQAFLQGELLW